MREILFRGKRCDNSEWVYGSLIHRTSFYGDPCDDYLILSDGEFDCDYYEADMVLNETVGQFTGLTDKNGKKIFEGDIIDISGIRFPVGFRLSSFCTLYESYVQFFFHEQFYWNHKERKWKKPNHITVVGNIHDNPELLEVT